MLEPKASVAKTVKEAVDQVQKGKAPDVTKGALCVPSLPFDVGVGLLFKCMIMRSTYLTDVHVLFYCHILARACAICMSVCARRSCRRQF